MQASFMFTYSGRRVDLPQPLPGQIHIEDVAVHLSRLHRFCGATIWPRSVAAHSIHVATLALKAGAPAGVQLAALLHDAHEAYSGDQTSPWKRAVGALAGKAGVPCQLRIAENMLQREVLEQLGARQAFVAAERSIHHWDMVSLVTERRDLAPPDSLAEHWGAVHGIEPDPTPITPMRGMGWRDVADDFLDLHHALMFQITTAAMSAAATGASPTSTTSTTQ